METSKSFQARGLLASAAGALLLFGIWWLAGKSTPPALVPMDPPALSSSENRIPDSAKCGDCHDAQYNQYLTSGHSKTLWTTRDFPFRHRFEGLKFSDVERGQMFHYFLEERGMEVAASGRFGGDRFPLQFAFGSGEHAITFVTLTPDGTEVPAGIEHRVSWFPGRDQADLTPGQLGRPVHEDIEYFGRVIRGTTLERCFECHTTSGRIEGDQLVDLVPNVGCESCHTDSARHAGMMHDVNPADSSAGLEHRPGPVDELQNCARCHRGVDSVKKSEITRENRKIVRYQPVGLVQSKCFVQSRQQLLCSTCHNPHQHASLQTTAQYEKKCLQCHSVSSPDSVRCSVSPDSDCVSCHMPRVEIHPSISFHDHWIRIRNDADPPSVQGVTDVKE